MNNVKIVETVTFVKNCQNLSKVSKGEPIELFWTAK